MTALDLAPQPASLVPSLASSGVPASMPTRPTSQPSPASPAGARPAAPVVIRPIAPTDSIPAITRLLHRAYAPQVAMGLRPLAGRQTDDVTADRCRHSEAWLAILSPASTPKFAATPAAPASDTAVPGERIAGIILFEEQEKAAFPEFFLRPEVAHFAQFAVDPDLQGFGIGRLLLDQVESLARARNFRELALSMAEPDTNLRAFYEKRGFRLVSYWQWPYTNYRSCILSKPLT